jgi:hypothetical protein
MLSRCASDPEPADIAQAIRDGDFDGALAAAQALQAEGGDTPELRLVIGAIHFARADFEKARRSFASAGSAGTYLMADADPDRDEPLLRTDIAQTQWLHLGALRSGDPLPQDAGSDPLDRILAGTWSPERYVDASAAMARQLADAAVLTLASSPGRDAMLDRLASVQAADYRCTGYFVAGEAALVGGNVPDARRLLRLATGQEVPLLEFYVARAELARLG